MVEGVVGTGFSTHFHLHSPLYISLPLKGNTYPPLIIFLLYYAKIVDIYRYKSSPIITRPQFNLIKRWFKNYYIKNTHPGFFTGHVIKEFFVS